MGDSERGAQWKRSTLEGEDSGVWWGSGEGRQLGAGVTVGKEDSGQCEGRTVGRVDSGQGGQLGLVG